MQKLVLAVAIPLAVLVSGCTTYWTKPGLIEAEFQRDSYECERDARMLPRTPQSISVPQYSWGPGAPVYSDPTLGWADVAARQRLFERCMNAKGYTKDVERTPAPSNNSQPLCNLTPCWRLPER